GRAVGSCTENIPTLRLQNLFAWPFFQDKNAIWFEQLWQFFVRQESFGKALASFRFLVGRIGKNNPEFLGKTGTPEKFKNVLRTNRAAQFCFRQILLDRGDRLSIFLDKENRGRAATERFNPKPAASGEKIENGSADYLIGQAGEDRCFHLIHRRPNATLRNGQMD